MKTCSSKGSLKNKTKRNSNKSTIPNVGKQKKAINHNEYKKQNDRYQCQNLNPQKAAKQQLIELDRYSPQKKQKKLQSYDQNGLISGWIERYLDSTNAQEEIMSPSHLFLSDTKRKMTENSQNLHNFVRIRNHRAMNQTVRISNNTSNLNDFSSMSSQDNGSTQIVQRSILQQNTNRQARATTSIRNRVFRNLQSAADEEDTIPKLKKLLKKLESPEKKKENNLQKWQKRTLIKKRTEQPQSYENFIERLRNRRGHTTKVQQILKSKDNKLNKEIPMTPNNSSKLYKKKNDVIHENSQVHDSIIHFLKMNKQCKNHNTSETPRFSKRYQQQRQERTLQSILK